MSDETETVEVETDSPEDDQPRRHGVVFTEHFGQVVLHPTIDEYLDLVGALRDDSFVQIIDVIGVDYLHHERQDLPPGVSPERFEIVVLLLSPSRRERIRIRLQVAEGRPVPTLFDLFPGTEVMEREAFDMFGIEFADHPDLSRILMPETWEGHPLRKDFDIGRIPVQFKGAPSQR